MLEKLNFMKVKQLIVLTLFFFLYEFAIAQNNSIILNNDVYIILSSNTSLNINQSNSAGIALVGTAQGIIRSEGESNFVNWIINSGTGTYSIPFGITPSDRIPINYQITTAGSNPGSLKASTYSTAANNTGYPSITPAVTNMNSTVGGTSTDRSFYATDRFWIIRKTGWTTEPNTKLTLTYKDGENASPNTITESNLLAEYWDGTSWLPGLQTTLLGTNNSASNQVNSINAEGGNFYTWILVDKTHPLPVELVKYEVNCNSVSKPELVWETASETNNMGFYIDKSYDCLSWENIGFIAGQGNSNGLNSYQFIDFNSINKAYYRLTQVDFDGTKTIKGILASKCEGNSSNSDFGLMVFENSTKQVEAIFNTHIPEKASINIYDELGQQILSATINTSIGKNSIVLSNHSLKPAMYILTYQSNVRTDSKRFVINK